MNASREGQMRLPRKVIEATLEPGVIGEYLGALPLVAADIIEALEREGYVIVPKEPTEAMLDVGHRAMLAADEECAANAAYLAMVGAFQ